VRRGTAAAGAVLVLVALNLRISIAALSPVLDTIQHDTGIGSAGTGVLTAVPVVCFGAVALSAPRLIRRFGLAPLLGSTMAVVAAGCALRLVPTTAALFAGTAVIGAGIAVGNVILPGIIKRDFAGRTALMTGLYSVSLFVGAAISAGLTVPIEHVTGLGWRPVLGLWGIAALAALGCWAPRMGREPVGGDTDPGQGRVTGLWSDPLAWQVTAFMGLQSFGYYAMLNWLPTILEDHGMAAGRAGWMLSFSAFPGMAAALATPLLGHRLRPQVLVVAGVASCAAGYAGLIVAPMSGTYGWMVLLGVGQGIAISLALGYIVARAPDSRHAAELSTMAQGVGYLIACTGPFLLGALHSATGGWTVPLVLLLAVLVPLLVAGLGACRARHVLDRAGVPAVVDGVLR
jgi:CP family cyanate transporter-like MFS transporter